MPDKATEGDFEILLQSNMEIKAQVKIFFKYTTLLSSKIIGKQFEIFIKYLLILMFDASKMWF